MAVQAGSPLRETATSASPLTVVVALALEARVLEQARRAERRPPIDVVRSGPGPAAAARAARAAVAAGARGLLSFGLAGGLASTAMPGTLLLPRAVVASDGELLTPDPGWRERMVRALAPDLRPECGPLAAVDRVLATPEEKAALGAALGAVAADMESAAIGREAVAAGIPFVVLRVVADGPADRLPARVADFVTADGRMRLAPLVGHLAAPRELGRLMALGSRSRRAAGVLEAAAHRLLRADCLAAAADAGAGRSESRP